MVTPTSNDKHTTPHRDLATVWTEYRAALSAFLNSRISNPADAEEVLQDILLKTHRNLDTLKDVKSLRAWLFQIANNAIIDFYRRKKVDVPVSQTDLWYEQDNEYGKHILEDCVATFINALPEEAAYLLRKIELEGASQKVTAEQLGISYSTLKSRVQSSRAKLLRLFQDCCDFSLDSRGNVMAYQSKAASCNDCKPD
ncbi:RNA polymerase sigma factor SigZ [Roseibium sp. MMSF_3412]|uniref:RNA polymerase sigma factor SigZ n=1 Tax=Roseibium sp. MMSF_3412 TaxID=3046712 RepID=UPI00273F243C|nr:RNA polymerase sigma factor SigZ [Roseibium sp. MMSF_3412]